MLITTELCRDVLCNEVILASNAAKANVMPDVMSHLKNMALILMSQKDFMYVDDDTCQDDLLDIIRKARERKEHE